MPKYSTMGLSPAETFTYFENDRTNEEMLNRGHQLKRLNLSFRQLDVIEYALRGLLEKPSYVKVSFPEAMPARFSPEKWEIFQILRKIALDDSYLPRRPRMSEQMALDAAPDTVEQVFSDKKALYKTRVDFGRMGEIEGVYVATDRQVAVCEGMTVYLGEVLGKHSEIYYDYSPDEPMTEILTDDPKAVELMEKVFGRPEALDRGQSTTVGGYNPLEAIGEKLYYDAEPEDEDEDSTYANGYTAEEILAALGYDLEESI